eukprot:Gregarina_sp_Pseudo_9__731@NODE_1467_length_1575_cov_34_336589_g1362_i0_p1_GENE_NODE_1467_length_1575_cov_34_336589_g1362_i0NODE_1467_length_1575_cov_34_336589_g1362_i0_p1_ORF_typecomplete_len357_score93_95UPF0160/PF03690_13/8e43_NODE_1467_length_1575_cov_34_336589_g1362_i01211191
MTTSIVIPHGEFSATQLVPAALAAFHSNETETAARVIQSNDPSVIAAATWCLNFAAKPTDRQNPVEFAASDSAESPEFWDTEEVAGKPRIPLTFSGRLWKHHGKDILRKYFKETDEAKIEVIHRKLYENVIQAIDAKTQHLRRCDCVAPHPGFSVLSFDQVIGTLDPDWEGVEFTPERREARDAALQQAFARVVFVLTDMISSLSNEFYPGLAVVREALEDEKNVARRVLKLSHYVPWQTYLYDEEDARGLDSEHNMRWVIFQDERSLQWRATSPAERGDRFKNRSLVDESLRGLRDNELSEKVGIEGCVFVHHTGFTCGGASLEAVLGLIAYNDSKKRMIDAVSTETASPHPPQN